MSILQDFNNRQRVTDPLATPEPAITAPPQPVTPAVQPTDPPVDKPTSRADGTYAPTPRLRPAMERPSVFEVGEDEGFVIDDTPVKSFEVPDAFLDAVKYKESLGNVNAVSPVGALGPYQVMPATARQPGFSIEPLNDPFDEQQARKFAKQYLSAMLRRYDGDPKLALIAYNWGVGNADRYANGEVTSLPKETQGYIDELTPAYYNSLNILPEATVEDEGFVIESNLLSPSTMQADPQPLEITEEGIDLDSLLASQIELSDGIAFDAPDYTYKAFVHDLKYGTGRGLETFANTADYLVEVTKDLADYFGVAYESDEEIAPLFTSMQRYFLDKARYMPQSQTYIEPVDFGFEALTNRPVARFARLLANSIPETGMFLATGIVNRGAAVRLMGAYFTGATHGMIQEDIQNGADVSELKQKLLPLAGGVAMATAEKFGLDQLIKAGAAINLSQKLASLGIAAVSEGLVESAQTAVEDTIRLAYEDGKFSDFVTLDPRQLSMKYLETFTTGMILGGAFSAGIQAVSSLAYAPPPDTELADFADDSANPRFTVTKPQHPLFGKTISLQEARDAKLSIPQWRLKAFERSVTLGGSEITLEQAQVVSTVLETIAAGRGQDADTFIEEIGLSAETGINSVMSTDLFHMIGLRAKLRPQDAKMYFNARRLVAQGMDANLVKAVTGWFQEATTGRWGFMEDAVGRYSAFIDTAFLESLHKSNPQGTLTFLLSAVLGNTNQLFEYYPELANLKINFDSNYPYLGAFAPGTKNIDVKINKSDPTWSTEGVISTIAHEIQHVIQNIEGFEGGGSANSVDAMRGFSPETDIFAQEHELAMIELRKNLTNDNINKVNDIRRRALTYANSLSLEKYRDLSDHMNAVYENYLGEIEARRAGETALSGKPDRTPSTGGKAPSTGISAHPAIHVAEGYRALDQLSEVEQAILFAYDNPDAEFSIENVRNVIRGAVEFKNGSTIIKLFEGANVETLMHEMAHVYRRFMSKKVLKQTEKFYKIEDGKWTRAHEETFARDFVNWVRSGKTNNKVLLPAFIRFRNWVLELHTRLAGKELIVQERISQETAEFFEKIVNDTIPVTSRLLSPVEVNGLRKVWETFIDAFSIVDRFRRVGGYNTGLSVKNMLSVQQMEVDKGVDLVRMISQTLRNDKAEMAELLLIAESKSRMAETKDLAERGDKKSQRRWEAVQLLRAYFDGSLNEYKAHGGLAQGFVERLRGELLDRIDAAMNNDNATVADIEALKQEVEALADLEYVHVSSEALMHLILTARPNVGRKTVRLLASRARQSMSLQQLIDDGVIQPEELDLGLIIQSYANRKGKDLGLLKLRAAAVNDGFATPFDPTTKEGEDGGKFGHYVKIHDRGASVVFGGYHVHPMLADWIFEMGRLSDVNGLFKRALVSTKLGAFINPFFLPFYDLLQGIMRGTFNIFRPVTLMKNLYNGINDVLTRSEEFYEAERQGIATQTNVESFNQQKRRYIEATRGGTSVIKGKLIGSMEYIFTDYTRQIGDPKRTMFDWLKIPVKMPFKMIKAIYDTSQDIAWSGNRIVRQVAYRHLRDIEGLSSRDAAQQAGLALGDYASVPPRTRRAMNYLFFTPTFKVAMAKFFVDAIRSNASVLRGYDTPNYRARSSVIIRSLGLLLATDVMMQSMFGFEKDEFGRRYFKRVSTERGPKELTLSFSHPHNLFLKYYNRFVSTTRPEVTNKTLHLFKQFKWEFHPLYNVSSEIVSNTDKSGNKIYLATDHAHVKSLKVYKYFIGNIYALFRGALDQELSPAGQQKFAEEFGKTNEFVVSLFAFPYEREVWELRQKQKIDNLVMQLQSEIGSNALFQQYRSGQMTLEELLQRASEAGWRTENMINRIDALINETIEMSLRYQGTVQDDINAMQQDPSYRTLNNTNSGQ